MKNSLDMIENAYKIRRVWKSNETNYLNALRIYNTGTPAEIKTDSNEISRWIELNPKNDYFEFIVFTIQLDDKIIGFSELAYFHEEHFVIIDYITLDPLYRVNAAFFPVLNLIQNYFINNNFRVDYILTEINNREEGENIDRESLFFKKLICLESFGIIDIDYPHPSLGRNNYESSFVSKLYIKTNDTINNISKETVLDLVKTLYFNYYYIWYKEFLSPKEMDEYKDELDNYLISIKHQIKDRKNIKIIYNQCPVISSFSMQTAGILPVKNSKGIKQIRIYILIISLLITLPLITFIIYNYIFLKFGIPTTYITSIVTVIVTSAVTVLIALWTNNKQNKL